MRVFESILFRRLSNLRLIKNQHSSACSFCFFDSPYNDGIVITAQILSIVAFLVSWIWWLTWLISAVGMILLQVAWCCRQNRFGFIAVAIVSGIATISCLFAGIWMLVVWKNVDYCYAFIWETYDYSTSRDYCNEGIWAGVAFFDMVLWLIVTTLVLYFVYSGRHQKWENKLRKKSNGNGVELTPGEAETNVTAQATAVVIEATEAIPVSMKVKQDVSV